MEDAALPFGFLRVKKDGSTTNLVEFRAGGIGEVGDGRLGKAGPTTAVS